MEKKTKGFKTYRHKENAREEALHDEFITQFSKKDMDLIVFGQRKCKLSKKPVSMLTERERRIVVSTVQWMGSSSGQNFLRNLGYCDIDEYAPKLHHISSKLSTLEKQLDRIPVWIKALFI